MARGIIAPQPVQTPKGKLKWSDNTWGVACSNPRWQESKDLIFAPDGTPMPHVKAINYSADWSGSGGRQVDRAMPFTSIYAEDLGAGSPLLSIHTFCWLIRLGKVNRLTRVFHVLEKGLAVIACETLIRPWPRGFCRYREWLVHGTNYAQATNSPFCPGGETPKKELQRGAPWWHADLCQDFRHHRTRLVPRHFGNKPEVAKAHGKKPLDNDYSTQLPEGPSYGAPRVTCKIYSYRPFVTCCEQAVWMMELHLCRGRVTHPPTAGRTPAPTRGATKPSHHLERRRKDGRPHKRMTLHRAFNA